MKTNRIYSFLGILITLTLFCGKALGAASKQLELSFTSNGTWRFPSGSSNKTTSQNSYTNGITLTLAGGGSGNGYYYNSDGYLIAGKSGFTITFPAFSFNTTQIKVTGRANASPSVKQNIFVGSTAVSTETTGAGTNSTPSTAITNTYDINSSYQAAGNIYVLKVTSTHNTQITKIEIWGEAASCTTSPTVTAGGNSTIRSTTATVTCSSGISSLGSAGCSITSYGFVLNTSGTPTISDTKHQVGTTYTSTGTSFSLDLTGLTPNTTYYVRPYATNGNGTAYGTQTSFTTLQRYAITYNSNGGSGTIASAYKDHGISFTLSNGSGFSKTGYTLSQWRLGNASTGDIYAKSGSYTTNAAGTFYAQWTANQYTITLDQNGATTDGTTSVQATYNSSSLSASITNPEKTHYIFNGWYSGSGGTGTLIIDEDGVLQASTSYTDASGNWTNTSAVTLYAKWTEHTYTNYRTSCCTELGTIDGEASLTQAGNSVTISGWSDVSNVGTYTVKLYKKNGASWDLVSGTTSGGSAGAQGTRTGITSGSKSVTYTGLEVESEYKFTVQAIAGSAAYCDGVETDVTEINSIDVSSTPFKFRYAIYIDDGTNDNYEYYYIEPTGNTDEGSVDIDLSAHVDYYQFKIAGRFSGWWGQTGTSKIPANTEWELDGSNNVRLESGAGGSYTFTVDYSSTNPAVTVTFPSADQDAGYVIYYDNSVLNWSSLYYRVGNNSSCSKVDVSLVPGTDKFYKVTTPDFDNMDAWHIANNYGWTGSNSIYRTKTSSDPAESPKAITNSIAFQQYAVTEDITVIPTSTHSTGSDTGDAGNSNCEFYTINTPTSGMLTHNAAITSYSHGTVTVAYTNTSGSAASFTSGNADLAHRCKLTITATPATGYSLSSLQVNSSNFTSGNEHILAADATITAVFTAQTSTVTLQATSATTGSDQTVLATYDASMPLVTTADKTPAVAAISRTGYTFNGWWDATSSGKQYYSHSAGTIASANNWDKTGSQTLYAQWIAKEYTITLDREGGSTGAESATATFDSGTLTGWSAPTKTGYTFGGYYSGDNGTGTLVISTAGVLQNSVTINAVNWTDASGHWIKEGGATVYAKWTANEYTISYKDQGDVAYSGSNSALLPTTHTYGAATDLVDGVKSGYRFDGWFDNSSCTGSAITSIGATAITANTTYYAKWTEVYTVTWHVNGEEYSTGVVTGNSQVPDGEKISDVPTAPADNTLSCTNKFMGWSAKSAGSTTKTTSYYDDLFTDVAGSPEITGNTTFYAVFAEVDVESTSITSYTDGYYYLIDTYGDKYFAMNGSVSSSKVAGTNISSAVTYNSSAKTITLDLENATLASNMIYHVTHSDGVYEIEATDNNKITSGSDANLTQNSATAKWNGLETSYNRFSFTYSYIDKSDTKYRTILYANGQSGFKNYATSNRDGSGYGAGYFYLVPAGTTSNYVTQCDANIVKVTYNVNGGSTSCTNTTTDKTEDYTVCSTPPTRDYYTFAGWLCSANDEVYAANATIDDAVIDADFTLTAQWTPVPYTITYNYNGGSAQVDPVPATSYTIESSAITLQTPTKGHDRFDGWYENADLSTGGVKTTIAAGSHENKTYYAKWTARHEIVFDADGATTTIYRADDEALNASVAGQGSIPANPSAPSACSSKEFVGWVAEEIDGETDDEPTFLDVTSKVNADKHYYAVWATSVGNSIAAVEDESFTGGEYATYFSKTYGLKSNDKYVYKNSIWTSSDMTAGTKVKIKVKHLSNSSAATLTIALINSSGTVVTSTTLSTTANSNNIDNAAYSSNVELIATTAVTGYQITLSNIGSSSGVVILAVTREVVATRSAYSTSCCATKVTLTQNDPEHGTIVFGKTSVGTCGGDKNVSLTITPAAGYQLSSYAVATGDGKVAAKSMSAEVVTNNNSSAAQNITLTFAEDANGAYDVTAAFSEMCATAWTWTTHDGGEEVTTEPLEVYVGQQIRIDVTYSPAGLLSSHTNNTAYNYSPYPWSNSNLGSPSRAGAYFTVTGTNAGSTSVVLNHNDGLTKTIYYTVKALPLVHFTDNVHNVVFADVAGTLEANALVKDKTTPTTSDFSGTTYNSCEEQHEHLVGWIESSWADEHPNATHSEIAGAGDGVFYTAGASIDVDAQNGKTFYAVWSKIE